MTNLMNWQKKWLKPSHDDRHSAALAPPSPEVCWPASAWSMERQQHLEVNVTLIRTALLTYLTVASAGITTALALVFMAQGVAKCIVIAAFNQRLDGSCPVTHYVRKINRTKS